MTEDAELERRIAAATAPVASLFLSEERPLALGAPHPPVDMTDPRPDVEPPLSSLYLMNDEMLTPAQFRALTPEQKAERRARAEARAASAEALEVFAIVREAV